MIFVLDTNVLWKHGRIARLATLARRNGHRVAVPALAHAERCAQLRRRHGPDFDPEQINEFLATHEIAVLPFDGLTAERAAEALANRYPSTDLWHAARRDRCAARLQVAAVPGGQTCPGTVDWYLAAPYGPPDHVVVTLDERAEFAGTGVIDLDAALALAEGR